MANQCNSRAHRTKENESYFRAAPKLVRFLPPANDSASLSSSSLRFLLIPADLGIAAEVGVAWADTAPAASLNDAEIGVAACDAGVDPTEPGVVASC